MKAHIGIDSRTKLIHAAVATPANVADSTVLLYAKIGQLRVERDFIAEVRAMTRAERVTKIARDRADLSVRRQCALLGLARSGSIASRRRRMPKSWR